MGSFQVFKRYNRENRALGEKKCVPVFASGWHPILVLMALYAVTTLLTEMVSNNASVVILVPVAIALGESLGIDIFPMVLAVMFAASTSFLSPIGYQTNTMIYGTGLYRFTDFARVGAPLNVILMVGTLAMLVYTFIVPSTTTITISIVLCLLYGWSFVAVDLTFLNFSQ